MPTKHNDHVTTETISPNRIAMALGGYRQLIARAKELEPGHAMKITRDVDSKRKIEGLRNNLLRRLDDDGLAGEFRTIGIDDMSFLVVRIPQNGETIPGL